MKKQKKNDVLPVYAIDTFKSAGSQSTFFDIKILEQHLREHEVIFHPHRHDCYLMLIVTQGTGTHLIDFVTYDASATCAFFLSPGQVHTWHFSEDARGFVIFFTTAFFLLHKREKHLSDFPFFRASVNPGRVTIDTAKEPVLIPLLEDMVRENSSTQFGRDEILRNSLDILLTRLSRHVADTFPLHVNATITLQLRQLDALLEKQFLTLRSAADYADLMHITPKHLNEVCQQGLHKTVSDLIHERQLLEIKRLLAFTTSTVKQIADHLGFNDKSYLMRFFKKKTDMTPEEFRDSYLKMHQHP